MKTVICYGDSNTHGYIPGTGERYPVNVRYSGRLSKLLGAEYHVIEEGLNGRTSIYDDPFEPWKNGVKYLRPCLNSHKPVDIVVLMLGSNDLKECFGRSAGEIAEGVGTMVDIIKDFTSEKQGYSAMVVLVSPPFVGDEIVNSPFYYEFTENAVRKSRALAPYYQKIAREKGCAFIDAAAHAYPSPIDALHLTEEGHGALAARVAEVIEKLTIIK